MPLKHAHILSQGGRQKPLVRSVADEDDPCSGSELTSWDRRDRGGRRPFLSVPLSLVALAAFAVFPCVRPSLGALPALGLACVRGLGLVGAHFTSLAPWGCGLTGQGLQAFGAFVLAAATGDEAEPC